MSDDLDATVEEYHRALDTFVTGDARALHRLYSRRDDVTIANPFGPPQRGLAAVEETTARGASHYTDGRAVGFDEVSRYVTPDLAFVLELEHYEAKVGGGDEMSRVSLRVTTVFRREGDVWRIMHRHADPITAPRPAESVVQS